MKNVKEVTLKIENDEWTNTLKKTFDKKKKDIKIDGFRKGAITWDLFVKKIGIESLYQSAVEEAVNNNYDKVIKDSGIVPVVEPSVEIKDLNELGVTVIFKIIGRPEIKLGEYKNLGIKKEAVKVSKKEITEEIEALRDKYAEIVVKENGEVVSGNTAIIDFKGVVDGKELEGGSGENYPLEIGSNTFIPGFEDALIGMKVNETKDINLKFPENYVDNLKNKDVTFTVTIKEIKERILPEVNEEFFKDLGYDDVKTLDELEAKVKEHLTLHKKTDSDNKYLDEVIKKAISNMDVTINDEIVHDEVHRIINQYSEQLKSQGMTLEQYFEFTKTNMEDLEKNVHDDAVNRIKERYLLEEVSVKEKIEVTDSEVDEEIERISSMYNISRDELLKMTGGKEMIEVDAKMRKTLEFLKNN